MPSPDPHTLHVQQLFVSHQTSLKASVLALEPRMAEAEDGGPFECGRQSLLRRFRGDWPRILREHLYVRYAGAARDHARNKAFAERWQEKQPLAPLAARRSAGGPGACEREPGACQPGAGCVRGGGRRVPADPRRVRGQPWAGASSPVARVSRPLERVKRSKPLTPSLT